MKAWETEAQFKWLVQVHPKWSLLPVCVLSSLTTSSVPLDMEPRKARGSTVGAGGQVEFCRVPRPPGRAGTVGSQWVGKPVLESEAPRNAVSCATRGQQRLGNESTRLRLLSLEGSGCSSGLLGFTFRGAAAEAGLSERAPASGLWEFFCLCFTAPR